MSVFRPRSKIVSGMDGVQAPFDRKGTSLGSRVGEAYRVTGAPRDELDSAITFYAQLQHSALDLKGATPTFTRASDGLYLPYNGGDWRALGNDRDRYESGKLLMEPAITNKCTNYNASPDVALTNVTAGGAGSVTRVSDADDIAASGLSQVTSGFVIDVDATGVGATWAIVTGTVANVNEHTLSAWVKKVSGAGDVTIRLSDNSVISAPITSTRYERSVVSGTPGLTTVSLQLYCAAGAKARFILNKLEELPVITSPIVTQGAAGQRAIDALRWSASSAVTDAEGMIGFVFVPNFNYNSVAPGSLLRPQFVTMRDNTRSYIYWEYTAGANSAIQLRDAANNFRGVTMGTEPLAGLPYQVFVRWNGLVAQVGYRNGSGWTWGVEGTFGGWTAQFIESTGQYLPFKLSDLVFYNEDRGTAWIEANYP